MEATEYDCQHCGACCIDSFGSKGYVRLGERDISRMERLGLPVILARNRHADPGIEPGDQLLPHWLGRTIGVERRYRAVRAFLPSVAVWFAVLDVTALFHLDDFTRGRVATGAYFTAVTVVVAS